MTGSSSESSQNPSQQSNFSDELHKAGPSEPKIRRGTINVLTEKLVVTLDKCLVTDRNAVRLIIAIAEAFGIDVSTIIVNKTSVRSYRIQMRAKQVARIREIFMSEELQAAVLHWDGKILKDMKDPQGCDRLAILVTNGDDEKILAVPKLETGTGLRQATEIAEVRLVEENFSKSKLE